MGAFVAKPVERRHLEAPLAACAHRLRAEEDRAREPQLVVAMRQASEANARARSACPATMSHELRTPRHGIFGMTALARETDVTPEHSGSIATIEDSGKHLLALVDDILDRSRIEAGWLELESVAYDPRRAVALT